MPDSENLAQTIKAVTDLWDEPLDEVHDIEPKDMSEETDL